MTVALLPPVTYGIGRIDADPLTEGPTFIRTRTMSRWHRPRTGVCYHDSRRVYTAWCGYTIGGLTRAGAFLAAETLAAGDPICATCDGRAAGAGQIDNPPGRTLLFGPRGLTPPRHCPGSRTGLYTPLPGGTTGQCLPCGDTHPIRAMGGPYSGRVAIVQHDPGTALVEPCPFHRWRHLTATNGRVHCTCGRPTPTPEATS